MRIRPKTQTAPEHWSKDFVEHLRTVHFSLVTVSVALIIILSSRTYDARAAASQMDEIVQLNETWPKGKLPPGDFYTFWAGESVEFGHWYQAKSKITHQSFTFYIESPMYWCHGNSYKFFGRREFPADLETFESWWDELAKRPFTFDSIYNLAPKVEVVNLQGGFRETLQMETAPPGNIPAHVYFDLEGAPCNENEPPTKVGLWAHDESHQFTATVASLMRTLISQPSIQAPPLNYRPQGKWWVWSVDGGNFFRGVAPRLFQDQFPDLVKAVQGRSRESLTTLASEIHSEARACFKNGFGLTLGTYA